MDWATIFVEFLKKIVRISGKKERREKSSEIGVKFENLEKMSKWTRLE